MIMVELLLDKLAQHREHGRLALGVPAGERGASVSRRVLLPWREAAIAFARDARGSRIDLVEVVDDRPDGSIQAVDVESEEAGAPRRFDGLVMRAQPIDEIMNLHIAPHPGREAAERRL